MTDIPEISEQLNVLSGGVKSAKRLSQKKAVQVVPTEFVGMNRAGKIGGLSAPSITTVYGPSGEGKSVFVFGLIADFQRQNHLAALVDAEFTADLEFADYCGVDPDRLLYLQPTTYENTVKEIEKIINNFKDGKKKGKIHPNTVLLLAIDSVSKLIPANELAKLGKKDRSFPLRAAMNSAWMDKLNVDIHDDSIHIVLVAHEKKTLDASPFEEQTHVKGGDALIYESRQQIRINVKKRLKEEIGGKKVQIGKVHRGLIKKNKLGAEGGEFYFIVTNEFSENGIGFDRVLEVMEECKLRDKQSICRRKVGAVWVWDRLPDGKLKGDSNFEELLRSDPELLENLTKDLNDTAGSVKLQVDEEQEDE